MKALARELKSKELEIASIGENLGLRNCYREAVKESKEPWNGLQQYTRSRRRLLTVNLMVIKNQ